MVKVDKNVNWGTLIDMIAGTLAKRFKHLVHHREECLSAAGEGVWEAYTKYDSAKSDRPVESYLFCKGLFLAIDCLRSSGHVLRGCASEARKTFVVILESDIIRPDNVLCDSQHKDDIFEIHKYDDPFPMLIEEHAVNEIVDRLVKSGDRLLCRELFNGKSQKQIAEEQGLTTGAICFRLKKLRKCLLKDEAFIEMLEASRIPSLC